VSPTVRTVVAIARADLRERTRRYAFLVALGLTCWLGWLASEGTLRVELGEWRGVLDSTWIGGSLAVVASTFLSLVGFWLVRGTIERDRTSGVGEILAATRTTRPSYLLGKWLSHTFYLWTLAGLLAFAALAMLARHREAGGFDLGRLWLPILVLALPALAFVAGVTVAFDVLPVLRGGLGNVAWLFAFGSLMAVSVQRGPGLDFTGLATARASMREDLRRTRGVDEQGFRVGGGPRHATQSFVWSGLRYTPRLVRDRALWIGAGALLALAVTPLFHRFDPSAVRRRAPRPWAKRLRPARAAPTPDPEPARAARASARDLPHPMAGFWLPGLVRGQLGWALHGRSAFFWLGAGILAAVSFAASTATAPPAALAYLWPVLLWSRLGAPEPSVAPVLRSCPRPVLRAVVSAYLAGVVVGAVFLAGPALRAGLGGSVPALVAALGATLFPPALALALGSWAGTPKAFEALYTALWYVAVQTPALDFMGATASPNPWPFLLSVPVLLLAAAGGRAWGAR
jgi:hypothetical protein